MREENSPKKFSNIFIIDDRKEIRRVIIANLRDLMRRSVITAESIVDFSDVKEAMIKIPSLLFKENHPESLEPENVMCNLVICDIEFPASEEEGISGINLVKMFREDERLRYLTFFMISDDPDIGIIGDLCELGVTTILKKTFSPNAFDKVMFRIISTDPDRELSFLSIEHELEKGNFTKAQALFEKDARLSAPKKIMQQGRILIGLGESESAEKFLLASAEAGDLFTQISSWKYLTLLYEERKDTLKTIQSLEKLRSLSPNNLERKLSLSELLIQVDRKDEAKEILKEAALARDIVTQGKAAQLLLDNGFIDEATRILERVAKRNIGNTTLANEMAIQLRKNKKYEEAERCYTSLAKVHPRNYQIWYNWAINCASWGSSLDKKDRRRESLLDRAEEYLKRALKEYPPHRMEDPDFEKRVNKATELLKKL